MTHGQVYRYLLHAKMLRNLKKKRAPFFKKRKYFRKSFQESQRAIEKVTHFLFLLFIFYFLFQTAPICIAQKAASG